MSLRSGRKRYPVAISFFEQYLAQAVDEARGAQEIGKRETHEDFLREWRHTTSCLLNSFFAVDSLVNYLAYESFMNEASDWFIEPAHRTAISEEDIKGWVWLPFNKRLSLLLDEEINPEPIPQELKARVAELTKLRNWMAHGNSYTIIFEHEFIERGENHVESVLHGTYDDPEKKEFKSTKFKSPAYLDRRDARAGLLVALEIIVYILKRVRWFHPDLITFHRGAKEYRLDGTKTAKELMQEFGLA